MNDGSLNLSVKGLGLAFGILWALSVLVTGLLAWLSNWGTPFVAMMGTVYIGYTPTLVGAIIGMIWAFIDGFIGGVILAWLYNRLK